MNILTICGTCGHKDNFKYAKKDVPKGATRIVTNFCPMCIDSHDGYFESFFADDNNEVVLKTEKSEQVTKLDDEVS